MKGHIRSSENNLPVKPGGSGGGAASLLIAFFLLLSTPLLYSLRFLDDNRLTSFQWAFSDGRFERTLIYVIAATCAAYILSRSDTADRFPALSLFTLSMATAVSVFGMPEIIIDAGRYFAQAKYLETHGPLSFLAQWGEQVRPWTDMPFVPFVFGEIFRLFGETRIFIQIFNALAFSLTVVTTYLIGKELWDRQTGFFAGLLLIAMPYLLTQIPTMLIDIATMTLVTLSVYFFIKVNKCGGAAGAGWALVACVAIAFTLLAKYSTWPMLLILPLIAFVFYVSGVKSSIRNSAIVFALTCLIVAPFLFYKADMFKEQLDLLLTYQLEGLGRWNESFASTFLFQTSPFITLFALAGVLTSIRRRDLKFAIPCFFLFFTLGLQVGRIRYLVPLLPMFAIMASYGFLSLIQGRRARRFAVYGIVGLSIAHLYGGFYPFLKSVSVVNLQMAGKLINSLDCPEIGVYSLAQKDSTGNTEIALPILDIYTDKTLIALNELHPGDKKGAIEKSPLRFTWEVGLPEFYRRASFSQIKIAAIISSEPISGAPGFLPESVDAGKRIKEFAASSGLFKYKTLVTIVGKDCRNTAID